MTDGRAQRPWPSAGEKYRLNVYPRPMLVSGRNLVGVALVP
jgi:hypothetical protein